MGYTIHTLSKGDPLGKDPVSGVAMRDIVDFAATRGRCRVTTKVQIRLHWILLMKDGSNVYQKLVVLSSSLSSLYPACSYNPGTTHDCIRKGSAITAPSVKSIPQCLSFTTLSLFLPLHTPHSSVQPSVQPCWYITCLRTPLGGAVPFERAAGGVVVFLRPEETRVSLWRNSAATPGGGARKDRVQLTDSLAHVSPPSPLAY